MVTCSRWGCDGAIVSPNRISSDEGRWRVPVRGVRLAAFLCVRDFAKEEESEVGRRLPVFLRGAESADLVEACTSERDQLMVRLGLLMGLRVSEIVKLRVEQLDLDSGDALIARAKGDKDRYVPIPSKLIPELAHWIGAQRTGWLFPSPKKAGAHLSTRMVQYLVPKAAEAAGIAKHVTPHKLRHTYATTLLTRGADVREVQELLGHSSLAVTEIYLHVLPDRLRGAVERL